MQPRDTTVAAIAGRQNGVVTRAQLLLAGMTHESVQRRVQNGLLIPVYRGTYRVGHRAPSIAATYTAAVLACGPGAVLGGRAAAHVQRLIRGKAPPPEVITRKKRRIEGVLTSRCRRMDRRDVTRMHGIPMTIVARTIVDLAGGVSTEELARAVHQAQVLHGVKPHHVEAVLGRRSNAPGAGMLRDILRGGALLSELERAFLALLKEEGLLLPIVNRKRSAHYVDCRWPEHHLTVELDSFRYHNTRDAWEHDRDREREARARGDEIRRYTWYDVVEHSGPTRTELHRLLTR
jgi:Transcriptional regulator, AbiEi antitoxin